MKVYAIIERYSNGESWEDYYGYSRTIELCATREKAIKVIMEMEFSVDEKEIEHGEQYEYVKNFNKIKELDNETWVHTKGDADEVIRTVNVINHEVYQPIDDELDDYVNSSVTYQYAIKEMEVKE